MVAPEQARLATRSPGDNVCSWAASESEERLQARSSLEGSATGGPPSRAALESPITAPV